MKVVWLIQSLVPYHHARFNAFSKQNGIDGILVQVTDRDNFSVLEFETSDRAYELKTLFPGQTRDSISSHQLRDAFAALMESVMPECICVSGWGMEIGWASQHWALKNSVPMVMFSESTSYDEPRTRGKEWIKSQLVRTCSAALVGGQPHKEYIVDLGMDPKAVSLGHNVVDSSFFAEVAFVRPDAVSSWMEEDPFFLICTRFGRKKNIPSVVRAYPQYRNLCKEAGIEPIRFALAGDGDLRAEIEQAISEEQVESDMILLGAMKYKTLPWLYQNCQALVHASTTEQWGLVVNEAMAACVPVIVSSRTGSAPDLVKEGDNGMQFDAYDINDIARALFEFTKLTPEQRAPMGQRSREIIEDWGPDRFASGLNDAVHCAVSTGARKSSFLPLFLINQLLKKGSE